MAALVVVAAPLSAATYTITLTSGGTFSTLYKPIDAPWNPQEVVFYDETGNLIGLAKSDISSIESDVEANGYGHVIDNTTMILGWAPNDKPADAGTAPADQSAQSGVAGPQPGGSEEPIYDIGNIPPTMQILPSATPGGPVYAAPAASPAPTEQPATSEQIPPQ